MPTGSRASCAPCWTRGAGNSDGAGPQALVEELLERATRAEDEVNRWRGKAEEAGQRAARAGGELAAEQRRSADLTATLAAEREMARAMLALERARADRLEAALAEARRPWLAKVLEGLRRKG